MNFILERNGALLQQKRKGTKTFVHLCKRVTQNPVNMFNPQILREDFWKVINYSKESTYKRENEFVKGMIE